MTTLDGVERTLRRRDGAGLRPRTAPRASPGSWAAQVSEVSDETTRVLLEVATWNGVNILRTSRKLGLRSEASHRFEKQLHPELAMRAQRIASRLMVELCGARAGAGDDRRRRRDPEPRTRLALRARRGSRRLLGMRDRARAMQPTYLERLGFGVEARRRRPRGRRCRSTATTTSPARST